MQQALFSGLARTTKYFPRMVRTLCAASLFSWMVPQLSQAESPSPGPILREPESPLILDRLSVMMRGVPASHSEKEAFTSGARSLGEFASDYKADPRFSRKLAEYWLKTLKIVAPTDILNIRSDQGRIMDDLRRGTGSYLSRHMTWTGRCGGMYNLVGPTPRRECDDPVKYAAFTEEQKRDFCIAPKEFQATRNECSCETAVPVQPYWNPTGQTRVCEAVRSDSHCGPNLSQCFPYDRGIAADGGTVDPQNAFTRNLVTDFTMEPGMLIARVVVEERSWDMVLRSTESVTTGAMETFLANWGRHFLRASPPGSYRKPGSETELDFAPRTPTDRAFRWVNRSQTHAGVLTTPAFQRNFNGWRAKANTAMEAFLCKRYAIPENAKQVPSDEADLTRRPYCQICHSSLEPMAQFFGRWPNLGDTNYRYNSSAGVSAVGSFAGMTDADTNGLARVFTNTEEFSTCAVHRAFEFLVGRSMSPEEATTLLPQLKASFTENKRRVWPVMLEIIESPSFTGRRR